MINARDLFVEISNQPVLENGESVGYFVKNSRMDALEELLSANSPQPAPVVPDEWTIQDAVKFCRETGRQDAGSAMEAWNACRAAMLQGSQPVSDRDELPCAQVKAVADLYALCWQSGEVVTYTPDSEKAAIWLNNYSDTCVQEYVKLE